MGSIYGKFIDKMRGTHRCSLCRRPFEDDEEEATIKYAESILEKLPESRRDG